MKRILATLIAVLMFLSLTACGESDADRVDGNPVGSTANDDQTNSANDDSSATQDGTEPVADDNDAENLAEPLVLVEAHINSKAYSRYLYDENGNITNEVTYLKGEETNNYVYTYLEQNDGTTLVRKLNTVESVYAYEYLYDANGMCIQEKRYESRSTDPEIAFSEENYKNTRTYEYDAAGRVLKLTFTSEKGGTDVTYTYDGNGRIIKVEEQDFNSEAVEIYHGFVYNDSGDITQKTYISESFDENVYDFETEYVYEEGTDRLLKKITREVEHGGTYYEVTYNYDENGNCTRMKITNNMGVSPTEYLLGEGALVNECSDYDLVFMPLSVALAQQATAADQ